MRAAVALIVASALLALTGCAKNGAVNSVAPPMGQMQVMLTDAPGNFDAVNLVVSEVSANNGSGWQVLSSKTSTVDLLSLNNGVFANLGKATVPAGSYNQVRLILAPGSTVVVGGVSYPLRVPSGLQSGLKLNGKFDVPDGGALSLQMDFDAARSIQQNGAGDYSLSPVIRVLPASDAGAIAGQIASPSHAVSVQVFQNDNLVASTNAKPDGTFEIPVLSAGFYVVKITLLSGRTITLVDVPVTAGQTLSIGRI